MKARNYSVADTGSLLNCREAVCDDERDEQLNDECDDECNAGSRMRRQENLSGEPRRNVCAI